MIQDDADDTVNVGKQWLLLMNEYYKVFFFSLSVLRTGL